MKKITKQEYFIVMRLHRDDLKSTGIKAKFSDKEMQWIASKMGELYLETDFWVTLREVCNSIVRDRR